VQRPVGSHEYSHLLWALAAQRMAASTTPPLSAWPCCAGERFGLLEGTDTLLGLF